MFKLKLWHPFATVIYSYKHPLQNPFFRVTVLNEGVQRLQVLTSNVLLFLNLEGKLRNNVEFWINFSQTRRCQPEWEGLKRIYLMAVQGRKHDYKSSNSIAWVYSSSGKNDKPHNIKKKMSAECRAVWILLSQHF